MERCRQMSAGTGPRGALRTVSLLAFILLVQAGCATYELTSPTLASVLRPRAEKPSKLVEATQSEIARGVLVAREGRQLPVVLPLTLEAGDEIRVEAPYLATIAFPGGHEATVLSNTRLRIGSISDLIGLVFVKARGYFRVQTDYVAAGVKGTEFWVEASPEQVVKAGVITGRITVESRAGDWKPVDLDPGEVATMERDQAPTKELKRRAELDAVWHFVRGIRLRLPGRAIMQPRR